MNRTVKEATVRAYHYENRDQLQTHLAAFLNAYNFAKRLKTLSGLTPYEAICNAWTQTPQRFRLPPNHLTSGLNTGDPPGELVVVDGLPEGGKIPELEGVGAVFTPDYKPEELYEIAAKMTKAAR